MAGAGKVADEAVDAAAEAMVEDVAEATAGEAVVEAAPLWLDNWAHLDRCSACP